ncbi:efflux RND transporter periplasmic adaptor subunit [Synechococcus sp. 1G10]|uniref:efflux RND transporter periplasmic adaptor subunit n=1 Tax=Synechococcus sp. 1G10 TaxID=2025605 RepID=UPI001E54905D|nr:efflux RND transporter periplasmic adaptor subunit [Synechococcus sp. 1G10]
MPVDPSPTPRTPRRTGPAPWTKVLIAVLLASTGVLGWITYDRSVWQPEQARQAASNLQTVAVTTADLGASTEASGVVTAVRKVNLSPNMASRIERLFIREGERIEAGQLVAEMESDELRAKLNQALSQQKAAGAQLEAARANTQVAIGRRTRHEPLLKSGAISLELMEELRNAERQAKINVDGAAAKLDEARYQIQQSEAALRNTKVFAPFAGIITRQFAQEGQFVTPTTSASEQDGATSTSIAELSSGLEVVAKIPEASLTEIVPGQKVEVTTDAFPKDVFQGRVKMVSPRAVTENEVNSFPVAVEIETGLRKLKPAMNVQVRFLAEPILGALVVPLAALTTGENNTKGVLRLQPGGGIEFVPVTVGRVSGEQVQVIQGLQQGERVLLSAPPADVQIPGYVRQK